MIDQSNNFYSFWCSITDKGALIQDRRVFYRSCQMIITKLAVEPERNASIWPTCADAVRKGRCLAAQMTAEEMNRAAVVYYRDRDDCGPGIGSRADLDLPARTEAEVKEHHQLLVALNEKPEDRTPPPPAPRVARAAKQTSNKTEDAEPARAKIVEPAKKIDNISPLSLAELISREMANLNGSLGG